MDSNKLRNDMIKRENEFKKSKSALELFTTTQLKAELRRRKALK